MPSCFLRSARLLVLMTFCLSAGAAAQQTSTQKGAWSWPPEFLSLVQHPEKVHAEMMTDLSRGRYDLWKSRLSEGANDGGSLYWWFLTDLLLHKGDKVDAYQAAVRAYVWTRVESDQCLQSNQATVRDLVGQWVSRRPILKQAQTRRLVRRAVVAAIDDVRSHIQAGHGSLRMLCLRADVVFSQTTGRGKHISAHSPFGGKAKMYLGIETRTLLSLEKELDYMELRKNSDIGDLWSAAVNAQPQDTRSGNGASSQGNSDRDDSGGGGVVAGSASGNNP